MTRIWGDRAESVTAKYALNGKKACNQMRGEHMIVNPGYGIYSTDERHGDGYILEGQDSPEDEWIEAIDQGKPEKGLKGLKGEKP